MTDYAQKIKDKLNKVTNSDGNETIQEPKVEECPIKAKIKEHGVKKVLTLLFKETYEVPHFITEDVPESIENTDYHRILKNSAYPDAHKYWTELESHLSKVGHRVPYHESKFEQIHLKHADKPITFTLVRNSNSGDKPSVLVEYDGDMAEAMKIIEHSGLNCNRLSAKQILPNALVVEITK
jgi:hypothetical protein